MKVWQGPMTEKLKKVGVKEKYLKKLTKLRSIILVSTMMKTMKNHCQF